MPGNVVTKEDIYHDLERRGIVFGIKQEAIDDLIDRKRMNERILIAEGIPAIRGRTAGLNGLCGWIFRVSRHRCRMVVLTMLI